MHGYKRHVHVAGSVTWRLEYRNMASPAARTLVNGVNDPGALFAVFGKVGRSPRVFAARDRDRLLVQLQTAALKKMGITFAGIQFSPIESNDPHGAKNQESER